MPARRRFTYLEKTSAIKGYGAVVEAAALGVGSRAAAALPPRSSRVRLSRAGRVSLPASSRKRDGLLRGRARYRLLAAEPEPRTYVPHRRYRLLPRVSRRPVRCR